MYVHIFMYNCVTTTIAADLCIKDNNYSIHFTTNNNKNFCLTTPQNKEKGIK